MVALLRFDRWTMWPESEIRTLTRAQPGCILGNSNRVRLDATPCQGLAPVVYVDVRSSANGSPMIRVEAGTDGQEGLSDRRVPLFTRKVAWSLRTAYWAGRCSGGASLRRSRMPKGAIAILAPGRRTRGSLTGGGFLGVTSPFFLLRLVS